MPFTSPIVKPIFIFCSGIKYSSLNLTSHKINNSHLTAFRHNKSLGQHFLKSGDTASKIVDALQQFCETETILEIGPGHGILTTRLLQVPGKRLYLSEIDDRIITYLREQLLIPAADILQGDFLDADLRSIIQNDFSIIGNFPYQISSQIIFKMLELRNHVPLLVGMFQREMAQRIVAKPGSRDMGVITVLTQAYYDAEYLFELAPAEFDPPPKVYSAVIRLKRRKEEPSCGESELRHLVKTSFGQRRKMLVNSLGHLPGMMEILERHQFEKKRAEQLRVEDFILLAREWQQQL